MWGWKAARCKGKNDGGRTGQLNESVRIRVGEIGADRVADRGQTWVIAEEWSDECVCFFSKTTHRTSQTAVAQCFQSLWKVS